MDPNSSAAKLLTHQDKMRKVIAKVDASQTAQNLYHSTGLGKLFDFFQGRATAFAVVFTVCGIILAFIGKLTTEYVALVGAIQALVFAHSWKEDLHDQRMTRLELNGTTTAPDAPEETK